MIEFLLSLIGAASTGRTKPAVPWLDEAVWVGLAAILAIFVILCVTLVP